MVSEVFYLAGSGQDKDDPIFLVLFGILNKLIKDKMCLTATSPA